MKYEAHVTLSGFIKAITSESAGAISMGAGAYLSSKSEKEVTEKESERKGIRGKGTPEGDRDKLVRFYRARGLKRQEVEAIAHRVALEIESKAAYTIGE